jgi:Ca-activated chloride channel homolog
MSARLWNPFLSAGLALLVGLALAAAVSVLVPTPETVVTRIPQWLADRLSQTGHRDVVWARPDALWLVPAAVLPYLVVTLRRSLVDVPTWQIGAQLLARVLVLLAAALALAQPSLESPIRGKTVVYVVDVSDSIDDDQLAGARQLVDDGLAQMLEEAQGGWDREDRTRLALVTYAGHARVQTIDADATLTDVVARHDGDRLASDHAAALRLAAALVDPETEGRVVLVSDGTGSLAEREDLSVAARELQARGITLHTRLVPPRARGDVLVEAIHLPTQLRVGETFEVAIDLVATEPVELELELERDGEPNALEPSKTVTLRGGSQQIKMQARVTKPGPVVFTARLRTDALPIEQNRSTGNDAASVAGEVRGRPKVLLASTDGGSSLASALRTDHLHVDTVGPAAIPSDVSGLRAYDLVIFSDLPARAVGREQQEAMVAYVEDFGGGFVMIGGEGSFGVGGWGGSLIDRLLPVRFEGERQREQPKLALILVIDKSGSMSSEDRLDLVKEASRSTASTLDPSDEIGVIAFDSNPHVLVRLQPAANRTRIASSIRRLTAGGGTNALPALREAYLQLAGSNALVKHVILLSDGQSPETGVNALLGDMRDADITVSSVGVGAGAGKDFLQRVASRGRGRYYYSHDGTDVPRIFSRDTREATRNAIVERQLFPRVAKNAQVLRGIDFTGAPPLRGIVPVKPKPLAEVLLRTHTGDALLVRGRRGLGRTAAFASDAKPRWAAAWLGWGGFAKLWSQIARDTMRQGAALLGGASININPGMDEGAYTVVVDVEAPEGFANDLIGEVEIVDPSIVEGEPGHSTEIPLELTAPGRYEAAIVGVRAGQRLVRARLHDEAQGGRTDDKPSRRLVAEAISQVSVPYPAELMPDQLRPRPELLAQVASGTNEGTLQSVLATPGDSGGRTHAKPLWPHVLWALLLPLLVLDIFLRRITLGRRRVA